VREEDRTPDAAPPTHGSPLGVAVHVAPMGELANSVTIVTDRVNDL